MMAEIRAPIWGSGAAPPRAAFLLLLLALTTGCADALSARKDDRMGIMFTSHHKTGTNLGLELEACFIGNFNKSSQLHSLARRCKEERTMDDLNWDGVVPPDCSYVIHFVRTPLEIVRSAYLYHRQQPPVEPWLARPVEQILSEAVPDNPFLPGETYNQYLVRMPVPVGVYAEMKGFSGTILRDMEKAYSASKDDRRVLTVCLEECWADFSGMVNAMADYMKLPVTEDLLSCVEKHNPAKHSFGTHSTHSSLTEGEMAQLRGTIARHDKEWFDGRFGKSPLASTCGKDKHSSTARHSLISDSWLDEVS